MQARGGNFDEMFDGAGNTRPAYAEYCRWHDEQPPEFLRRKNLREAKSKLNSAIQDANRIKSAEEIAKEVKEANERRIAEEAAAEKKKMLDELAARAARKAALNAKWGGGTPNKTPSSD